VKIKNSSKNVVSTPPRSRNPIPIMVNFLVTLLLAHSTYAVLHTNITSTNHLRSASQDRRSLEGLTREDEIDFFEANRDQSCTLTNQTWLVKGVNGDDDMKCAFPHAPRKPADCCRTTTDEWVSDPVITQINYIPQSYWYVRLN